MRDELRVWMQRQLVETAPIQTRGVAHILARVSEQV
jgi:hypothetical protein